MAQAMFTVPSTDVYVDTVTGARVKWYAGRSIPLDLAVRFGMPGAALPADGPPFTDAQTDYLVETYGEHGTGSGRTITNWFPDGAITSDALIDTAGDQDYEAKLWYGQGGSEALTFESDVLGAPALGVGLTGWGDGVYARDWAGAFGFDELPIGRYQIGFDFALDASLGGYRIRAYPLVQNAAPLPPEIVIEPRNTLFYRYVMDVYTQQVGYLGLAFEASSYDNSGKSAPADKIFYVRNVTITDGNALAFRDGDSDGWDWLGTPHASASAGPQP